MHLTFLGTGTSMGIPVIGCTCPVCTSTDPHNQRMRTSALLNVAGQQILIDAGPDFRAQALAQNITTLSAVLLTHSHYDHVAGLDDLRPLIDYNDGTSISLYGHEATLQAVRERFSYAFTAPSEGSTRPSFTLCPVGHYEPFTVPEVTRTPLTIVPFDVLHGTWTITGFRIGQLGYITDASDIPLASRDLLRDLDVLVLNALRYRPHPTHLSVQQALEVVAELRPRRSFFVHMNHDLDHTHVNALLPPGVALAYDGLRVTVAED